MPPKFKTCDQSEYYIHAAWDKSHERKIGFRSLGHSPNANPTDQTMATVYASVKYKYRKVGSSGSWASTSWSGLVSQESEAIVMQLIRDKHKGCEVTLVEIKWR